MKEIAEIKKFAEHYRLRIKRDDCSDSVIRGRFGHVYPHGAGLFGLMFQAEADDERFDNTLRARRRMALRGGMQLHQVGTAESIVLFDPAHEAQSRLAIKLSGIKRKRLASPAQLANLRPGLGRNARRNVGAMNAPEAGPGHAEIKETFSGRSVPRTQPH